jgi:hypothetical protein
LGWNELWTTTVPSKFAKVYIGNASIFSSQAFITYFDNFVINSGVLSSP